MTRINHIPNDSVGATSPEAPKSYPFPPSPPPGQGHLSGMDNACYHHGLPLRGGAIEDLDGRSCVKCPWHGYLLELGTGEGLYWSLGPDMRAQTVKSKGRPPPSPGWTHRPRTSRLPQVYAQ